MILLLIFSHTMFTTQKPKAVCFLDYNILAIHCAVHECWSICVNPILQLVSFFQLRYQKCLVARPPSQRAGSSSSPSSDSVTRRVTTSVKRGVQSLIDTLKPKKQSPELPQQWPHHTTTIHCASLTIPHCNMWPVPAMVHNDVHIIYVRAVVLNLGDMSDSRLCLVKGSGH